MYIYIYDDDNYNNNNKKLLLLRNYIYIHTFDIQLYIWDFIGVRVASIQAPETVRQERLEQLGSLPIGRAWEGTAIAMRWSKWFPLKSGWKNRINMDKYAYSKIIEDDFSKCEVNTNGKCSQNRWLLES